MIQREITRPPVYVYPPDEWRLVERRLYPRLLPQTETFFSLSNGYFGMRGGFEEGHPSHEHGTFVNGFYESWPIVYGEEAHGFATTGQTIVNLPDPKIIGLYVDDERLYLARANLEHFERALDMRARGRSTGTCPVGDARGQAGLHPIASARLLSCIATPQRSSTR